MRPEDRDSLFWALSEIAERSPQEVEQVEDSTLAAYRAGELDDVTSRQVERLLARHPAARRRLAELAGATPDAAPDDVRRRVLDAASEVGARQPAGRPRTWRLLLAAAALIALALAVGWLSWRTRQAPLPAYEVRIAALAERRDAVEPGASAEAFADSRVTITATVLERAFDGIEVGLYRLAGERFVRLEVEGLEVEERRGVVELTAPAADLVGRQPGDYEILVVIAWRGRLPASLSRSSDHGPAAAAAAGGRRQIHRLTLRLLAETSAMSVDSRPEARSTSDEEADHVVSYVVGSSVLHRSPSPLRPGQETELGTL